MVCDAAAVRFNGSPLHCASLHKDLIYVKRSRQI